MVHSGKTGALVPAGETNALRVILRDLLSRPELADMGATCRQRIESTYSLAHQAERYAALYQDLIRG